MHEDPVVARQNWHEERMRRLRAEDGWLTLVGLVWLEPGVYPVGRGASSVIRADGFTADHVGNLEVDAGGVLRFTSAADVRVEGLPEEGILRADDAGPPTMLRNGSCTFFVIRRAGRLALRLRDAQAPLRTALRAPPCFPFDAAYDVQMGFTPAAPGVRSMTQLIIGAQEEMTVAGRAQGSVDGEAVDLLLFTGAAEDRFFLVFGDATNGRETYGGGRFAEAVRIAPDRVRIDFNRAYAPPCAFTPYATCPLPPASNRLSVRVEAGEMMPVVQP